MGHTLFHLIFIPSGAGDRRVGMALGGRGCRIVDVTLDFFTLDFFDETARGESLRSPGDGEPFK